MMDSGLSGAGPGLGWQPVIIMALDYPFRGRARRQISRQNWPVEPQDLRLRRPITTYLLTIFSHLTRGVCANRASLLAVPG